MELTGKCKEAFEEWLYESEIDLGTLNHATLLGHVGSLNWSDLPESMQIGVYEDFFESVGKKVIVDYDVNKKQWFVWSISEKDSVRVLREDERATHFNSRQEARVAGIRSENELFNNR